MKHHSAWASLALIFAVSPVAVAQPWYGPASLPTDTVLKVRLNNGIGSQHSRPGDHFTATVEDPSFPRGTLVDGVVIRVRRAGKSTPGAIGVDFRSLELPGGRRIPIAASPVGLDSNSVRTTASGGLVARSHSSGSNSAKDIGIGAVGGLLVGSLFGKNVVGGLLGAGAGYLYGKHHSNRNVTLKRGTELGVRLDRSVVLARA